MGNAQSQPVPGPGQPFSGGGGAVVRLSDGTVRLYFHNGQGVREYNGNSSTFQMLHPDHPPIIPKEVIYQHSPLAAVTWVETGGEE